MANNDLMSSLFVRLISNVGEEDSNNRPIYEDIHINKTVKSTLISNLLNDDSVTVSASSIQFHMAMYEPDHYTACINVNGLGLNMVTLANKLSGLRASILYLDESKNEHLVSTNLFVYQAIPSIVNNSSETIKVRLEIYSADKLLDLQKFSRAFTGMSISESILTNEELDAFVPKTMDGENKYELQTRNNLQVLQYKTNDESHEVIQPYLAQYNETFRSLLNRTTNRCGEFLYWHNGMLQYGLHNESDAMTLDGDTATITMSGLSTSKFETLNVSETHRNGKKTADFSSCGAVNYDLETGMPDYNETVKFAYGKEREHDTTHYLADTFGFKFVTDTTNKKYGEIDWDKSDFKKYVIGTFLTKYAKTGNFIDFVSDIVVESLVTKSLANVDKFGDSNDAKRSLNLKRLVSDDSGDTYGFKKHEQTNFGADWDDKKKQYSGSTNSVKDYDNLESTLKLSPFSTLGSIMENHSKLLDNSVLSNAFYSNIRKYGKKAAENAIDITMNAKTLPAYIGQRIKIKDDTYVVTGVTGSCHSQKENKTEVNEQDTNIELSTSIHAIPASSVKEHLYYLPEPLPEQNRKMDGNSTAYICDTDDPYGQGRVRVRFSWQGKNHVELDADDKKKCWEEALEKVYAQGSADKNAKKYDADQNNFLYKYRDTFNTEILEKKKDNPKLSDIERKIVLNTDEIEIYEFNKQYYPKTIADKLVKNANDEAEAEGSSTVYTAKKVESTDGKPHTYAEIANIVSRISKVEKYIDENETVTLSELEKSEGMKDATPWIRMASPMAGNATFYMKPSAGDEVIVGFENGNPERPYVLGSLFNGSSKSPSGFGITMANGHGISLEDEDMSASDLVGALISPVAKRVLDRISDNSDDEDPTQYHVGGKVSIKDKYGFYSLSMSSADRAVSINCPLGNISLSAFTGITISAPNGDINIKGKNVNITAGDRLTLTSGTNKDIKDADMSDVTGMITNAITKATSAVIDHYIGDIKVVDLSLARSVWEVIFRPINGTMAVSSKRHLLLQAGKGKAEMPVDTIETSRPSFAMQQFPNYPFYLMQDFMTSIDDEYNAKMSALENAFNVVCLAVDRKRVKNDKVDKDPRPTETDYNDAMAAGVTKEQLLSTLTKEKLEQIVGECVKKEGGKFIVKDSNILKLCPFPDKKAYKADVEAWKSLVTSTAKKVANLGNIAEGIKNWNIINEPATKAFMQAMNGSLEKGDLWTSSTKGTLSAFGKHKLSETDFGDLSKFVTDIRIQKCSDTTNTSAEFKIEDYIKTNPDLAKFVISKFTADKKVTTEKIQLCILRALNKLELISLVVKEETVVSDVSKYHTQPLPQKVDDAKTLYGDWGNFLKHVVVSDSITDLNTYSLVKSAVSGFFGFIGNYINDTLTDAVDYENLNWMFGTERRVWNTNSHPGLILMSSENGSTTAVLDKNSQLTASKNHSLKSLLGNMATKNERTDIQMGTSVADSLSGQWTQTL